MKVYGNIELESSSVRCILFERVFDPTLPALLTKLGATLVLDDHDVSLVEMYADLAHRQGYRLTIVSCCRNITSRQHPGAPRLKGILQAAGEQGNICVIEDHRNVIKHTLSDYLKPYYDIIVVYDERSSLLTKKGAVPCLIAQRPDGPGYVYADLIRGISSLRIAQTPTNS